MCAYVLTKAGAQGRMLEAGRDYRSLTETPMVNLPKGAPLGAVPTPHNTVGVYRAPVGGAVRRAGRHDVTKLR